MVETIIIGKSPILEDPLFDYGKYKAIKNSSNFDELLKYIEERYDIVNLLKVSNVPS